MAAVCWHGHRDFFRHLFKVAPEARIYTALIRRANLPIKFWSKGNFEENFEQTGDVNIGSAYRPVCAADACFCEETPTFRTIRQDRLTSECWIVQMWGLKYCDTCEFKDTDECGGKNIRLTGRNEKGLRVPV